MTGFLDDLFGGALGPAGPPGADGESGAKAPNARVRVLGAGIAGGGADDSHAGLGVRDGVALVGGDYVLDVGHSTAALRGYWLAAGGAWTRPSFYATDADVDRLLGTLTTILEGTLGTTETWRHVSGDTIAGSKVYDQVLGNPDTVVGENGSISELGHDEGTSATRARLGSRIKKEIATTIAAGATATVWDWDGTALGVAAGDVEGFAPNVFAKWASDSACAWACKPVLVLHGAPPVIKDNTRLQQTLDGAGGANGYITLVWDLSGNILRLRATNNRASACSVRVIVNYGAFE